MSQEQAEQNDFAEVGCTHRCLKLDDHVEKGEPHSYGYRLGPHAADDFIPDGYMLVKKPTGDNNSHEGNLVGSTVTNRSSRSSIDPSVDQDIPKNNSETEKSE